MVFVFLVYSFSIKMKTSINLSSAHTLRRRCLRCTFWCSDWLHRGKIHVIRIATTIRYVFQPDHDPFWTGHIVNGFLLFFLTCDWILQLVDQNIEDENFFSNGNSLSDSTYVPIKNCGHISGTESDDSSIRSVRFSKLAEVREMSPHDATEALMSRLSYAASMRIRRQKTNHKTARTALMFCVLVSAFDLEFCPKHCNILSFSSSNFSVVYRKLSIPIGTWTEWNGTGSAVKLNIHFLHINLSCNVSIVERRSFHFIQINSGIFLYRWCGQYYIRKLIMRFPFRRIHLSHVHHYFNVHSLSFDSHRWWLR